jgi:hypothetical protein
MIKLKDLLFEQTKTKTAALAGITTKYPKTLAKIFIPLSSQQALAQFEPATKKEVGIEFDKFVEANKKKQVEKRGKLSAAFGQLPDTKEEGEKLPPINDAFNIDAKSLFIDDSAEAPNLTAEIQKQLSQYKNQKIKELTQENPGSTVRVGFVNYNIIATTSKVPSTKYRDNGGLGGGNKALAKARYDTMYSSFAEAGKAAGIPGYIGDPAGAATNLTNMELLGPVSGSANWGNVERKKYKKDENGVRRNQAGEDTTAEYERLYAPHRKTYINVTVQILVEGRETEGKPIPGEKNETYAFSLTRKPTTKITIPPIRLGKPGSGLFSTKVGTPGECPAFSKRTGKKSRMNPGNKTRMGRQ